MRIHGDHCNPGLHAFGTADLADIHVGRGAGVKQHFSVGVPAHGAHQPDVAAEPSGRNRLVGALAAGIHGESGAVQGLPGAGRRWV